ncbi:hypothetical protein CBFG_05992 [Clostridiales bacterium 1_7_47FAA]|nr:hypothetical protein CBFG_05992 [Clostridiales bacterium 1_7_47FAA]
MLSVSCQLYVPLLSYGDTFSRSLGQMEGMDFQTRIFRHILRQADIRNYY